MYPTLAIVAAGMPSTVLRYAAAFFFVAVAIGLVFALIRLGRTLGKAEQMLTDVNTEVIPLLKQATETLDNVNDELEKFDTVMATVVDVTGKVDATTRAMEAAVSVPAKKAAAWGAGVSQAVSSLFGRHEETEWEPSSSEADTATWRRSAAETAGGPSWAAADTGEPSGFAPPSGPAAEAGGGDASAPVTAGDGPPPDAPPADDQEPLSP